MNAIEDPIDTTEPLAIDESELLDSAHELSALAPEKARDESDSADAEQLARADGIVSEAEAIVEAGAVEATSDGERPTRRKLEEQLEALKRKEVELRRALVMADHPELADSIRILQGRTYALERVEAKLALGLTKAELRRRETLQKKLASLAEKRAELDALTLEVQTELDGLGTERQLGYEAERRQGLEELLVALGTHDPALHEAGIEATELVPEIARWLPEIEVLAESLASKRTQSN